MDPKARADMVSRVGLSKAIDQAVALAAKKHDITYEPGRRASLPSGEDQPLCLGLLPILLKGIVKLLGTMY